MVDENQMHMILLFAGGVFFWRFGLAIWAIQWFMLYHNMIKNRKAQEKARWGKGFILMGVLVVCAHVAVPYLSTG